ncbi:hypothetical protein SAM23877_4446 [Streptomyces ambofaciens ATCC 23877]|uniref:Uncharacterized protein n=1 Tax=Streptomyces ambofaciens (strain ATCC 23877 / 3486 / DSM 40053 / JCM 4204 / NBRC 12836 / NRRL B-2516) TaxID=278992 RepID=A0A0K2AX63_STRA7|nr:hypothetical protein SAM23877_4446 [Streptomyces ambofaciens ATCC 23877]
MTAIEQLPARVAPEARKARPGHWSSLPAPVDGARPAPARTVWSRDAPSLPERPHVRTRGAGRYEEADQGLESAPRAGFRIRTAPGPVAPGATTAPASPTHGTPAAR